MAFACVLSVYCMTLYINGELEMAQLSELRTSSSVAGQIEVISLRASVKFAAHPRDIRLYHVGSSIIQLVFCVESPDRCYSSSSSSSIYSRSSYIYRTYVLLQDALQSLNPQSFSPIIQQLFRMHDHVSSIYEDLSHRSLDERR